jgi:hypothetical protein
VRRCPLDCRFQRVGGRVTAPTSGDREEHLRTNLLSVSLAAAAIALFAVAAHAQQKAPEKAPAPAPAAKAEKKAAPAKAKSACNAITEEAACKADATCSWIAALTDKATGKQKRKAYCKTKSKPPAKKKAADPKEPAKK